MIEYTPKLCAAPPSEEWSKHIDRTNFPILKVSRFRAYEFMIWII